MAVERVTVIIATDGVTDIVNMTPNFGGVLIPTSGSRDMAAWSAVETAIANANLPASAGTVLVSGTDTTAGFVGTKVAVTGTGATTVTASTTNPGANEIKVWTVAIGSLGLTLQAAQTAGFTAAAGSRYPVNIAASGTILMPASATLGDVVEFDNYGAGVVTWNFNGLKYRASTSTIATNAKGQQVFIYTDATNGWIDG